MRALLVYGSELDNSALLAREIAAGLGPRVETTLTSVGFAEVPTPGSYDLLLVGCAGSDRELQAWLRRVLPQRALLMAAYDVRPPGRTRRRSNSAATLTRALRRLGGPSVVLPRTFHEEFANGPLRRRELGRAGDWGRVLALLIGGNPAADGILPNQRRRAEARASGV